MQGLLLNLTPGGMLTAETANHVSPDVPEDVSMHESLTMEQFNSPLVSPQYKSTYAIVANSGEYASAYRTLLTNHNRTSNNKLVTIYKKKIQSETRDIFLTQ